MPASLAEVARRAGVSIATASRALNGSTHPVSDEARQRITVAARELGYSPSALARALVTRRSRILGLIVGDIVDPYFAEITRGAEDVARRHGFLTIICNADRRPAAELAYLRLLRDYQAEGILFAGGGQLASAETEPMAKAIAAARDEGTEVVALAARTFDAPQVVVDNRAACYDITSYVLSLGHRRVAFVDGPVGFTTAADRRAGYEAAMTDAGGVPGAIHTGNFDYESGRAAAARMAAGGLPDAVVCSNDESAIGVVMTLRQAGVEVPGQVSVAGIDDIRASSFVDLTTVSVPMYELGALGARRILEAREARPSARTVLPHRLVVRGSTERARKG